MKLDGIWLPIITPFVVDKVDLKSYEKLINYYIDKGISGFMPLGTTGESPTVSDMEYELILDKTMEYVNGRVPVVVGAGGNYTKKVIEKLKIVEKYKPQGILSVSPYYNRPDQRGIYEHFKAISEATNLDIVLYNIPYRTGRNIELSTVLKLSELKNIVGIKDACGDMKQSMSLILNAPSDFSVMTGEDILLYNSLLLGGSGGILASSHLETEKFIDLYNKIRNNDHKAALSVWKQLSNLIPLLFEEPNPAPIKYCLKELELIASDEVRLPLVNISDSLKSKLNMILK
jgi:4-hydroxy-tetrahydrodipicolinate synthase